MKNLLNKTVEIQHNYFTLENNYVGKKGKIVEEYLSTEDTPDYDIKVKFDNGLTELFNLNEIIMLGDDL